jgi:uncharacterized protein (TIGR03792 family)
MVIEWLKFTVDPNARERFVQQDENIWTPMLARYPGFLGKQVWIGADRLDEIVLVMHWDTMEHWKAIPPERLQATEAKFRAAMGDTYELVESKAYQVRRFFQPPVGSELTMIRR